MKILQLSDIHYGADYDGKFNTANQWATVVKDAKARNPKGYDAVIITGDLVDDDPNVDDKTKATRYEDIFSDALNLCVSPSAPVLVTPGNHDNRKILTEVADCLPVKSWNSTEQPKGFEDIGSQCHVIKVGSKVIVLLDSGTVEPYKGIVKLAAYTKNHLWYADDAMIFTHKPFRTSRLYHRFMKDNLLPTEVGDLIAPYTCEYFCGHFHHLATVNATTINNRLNGVDINMHVCPGIQCQIDPYSAGCVAIPIPGYQVISFESHANAAVYVTPYILDDYVVKDKKD